jgi:serine/threonine protein kinase, bacterial
VSHTSTENRIPTKEILLPGQEFCIGLPWEREQLPTHGAPLPAPKAKGNALDARVLDSDPCAGWEIGACTVIRRLSPNSVRNLLAVRDGADGESVVTMRKIELPDVLSAEVQANARWASQFRHPNVARVYDCEVSDEGIFWVTALASGAALGEIFDACKKSGRGIPVGLALSTVYEAARGLAELHSSGSFAHALVSDQSVWVGFDGSATLSDVGLFRCIARKSSWADFLDGMGPYLAPEQVLEGRMPDPKTDVFSLAVVLYECLATEKALRTPDFESRVKLLSSKHPFRPISSLNMALGTALDPVMEKALSRDRSKRYANAAEFAKALQQAGGAFMWNRSQRERFVGGLFPDRLRREQVLLDQASPEVRPRVVTRRVATQPFMKAIAMPPPLPKRAPVPVPVQRFEPPPRVSPAVRPERAERVARAPQIPPVQVKPAKVSKPARRPSRWRAVGLLAVMFAAGGAWYAQSDLTPQKVDHAVWKVVKNMPEPDQLQDRAGEAFESLKAQAFGWPYLK